MAPCGAGKHALRGAHLKIKNFEGLPLVASLLLVVRPGAPSSVLAPSSKARSPLVASLLLVVRPGVEPLVASLLLVVRQGARRVASLLLVVRPGAPSSVLAPSNSKARSS